MERDFLGLSSKEHQSVVKEEINTDGDKEIGFTKVPVTQLPFKNNFSALPHFMSFKAAQDDKTKKISSDALMSPAFMMATSTADGNQNLAGTDMKPQLMGGVPVTTLHSIVPSIGSASGITEPRNAKAFNSPAQLTIFYAGTVNVFDGISPEKAEAIMMLAGNVSMGQPKIKVQAPNSTPAAGDCVPANHPMNAAPNSDLASSMSVSLHTGAQSGSGSTSTEGIKPAKITRVATPPVSVPEPPKTLKAMGSVPATTMTASAVPQARKASLARFLEKRKERVLNAAPYNFASKSPKLPAMNQ